LVLRALAPKGTEPAGAKVFWLLFFKKVTAFSEAFQHGTASYDLIPDHNQKWRITLCSSVLTFLSGPTLLKEQRHNEDDCRFIGSNRGPIGKGIPCDLYMLSDSQPAPLFFKVIVGRMASFLECDEGSRDIIQILVEGQGYQPACRFRRIGDATVPPIRL
jgi:hypothetical protein